MGSYGILLILPNMVGNILALVNFRYPPVVGPFIFLCLVYIWEEVEDINNKPLFFLHIGGALILLVASRVIFSC